MELSQGKQSKSGKKRKKRRVRMKNKENWGSGTLSVSPSSSPQPYFHSPFIFVQFIQYGVCLDMCILANEVSE